MNTLRHRPLTQIRVGQRSLITQVRPICTVLARVVQGSAQPALRQCHPQHDLIRAGIAPFAHIAHPPNRTPASMIVCEMSQDGSLLTVRFHDATYTFHAQWLHDARCDNGPARDANAAFCQQHRAVFIEATGVASEGDKATLNITWNTGEISRFPIPWLRVFAPLVAGSGSSDAAQSLPSSKGWLVDALTIPEVRYNEIFPESSASSTTVMRVLDDLLHDSSPGIVRVTDLPAPNIADERNKVNTLVTRVLKQLFGSVFVHPRRGMDKTFNVASHQEDDAKRAIGLPNYDTSQVLLPHCDHAHYDTPAHVMGLYGLEGESVNTYVSGHAVLATLREESPELFDKLCKAPIGIGRVAPYYDPPMYQATVDTAVTMHPGFPDKVKRFRWHPHLSGSLLSTFDDFRSARAAHQKFQEIMRRDTHQLKLPLEPGDLYIWDNFRLLHGRERVLKVPRTSVGQTVPEQVVSSRYRDLKIAQLKPYIDERWLVQVPTTQLNDLLALVDSERTGPGQV